MIFDTDSELVGSELQPRCGAALSAALPGSVAWSECAAAALRAYLERCGLSHYRIFYARDTELSDLDAHLLELTRDDADPATPAWEPALPGLSRCTPIAPSDRRAT